MLEGGRNGGISLPLPPRNSLFRQIFLEGRAGGLFGQSLLSAPACASVTARALGGRSVGRLLAEGLRSAAPPVEALVLLVGGVAAGGAAVRVGVEDPLDVAEGLRGKEGMGGGGARAVHVRGTGAGPMLPPCLAPPLAGSDWRRPKSVRRRLRSSFVNFRLLPLPCGRRTLGRSPFSQRRNAGVGFTFVAPVVRGTVLPRPPFQCCLCHRYCLEQRTSRDEVRVFYHSSQ